MTEIRLKYNLTLHAPSHKETTTIPTPRYSSVKKNSKMDSSGFEPEASRMPSGRSSADLRALKICPYNTEQQIKLTPPTPAQPNLKKHQTRSHPPSEHHMKQRTLEIQLQDIPAPLHPDPTREQYLTPAPIAADLLYTALTYGDITDKTILDLGCGTGIFAVGAHLLGATHITGIDNDPNLITQAQTYAQTHHYPIDYHTIDITNVTDTADTVLMNPPFGAQKANRNADRRFLETAIRAAPTTYSLHLTSTLAFLTKLITACDATISYTKTYKFTLPAQFTFHTKLTSTIDVTLLRIIR